MICQVSKVATAILTQLVQELPQLRGSVITRLDFLGREFGSCAGGEWICGTQDVIEQREGRFNLEVMGGAPAASRLLVELARSARDGKVSRASPSVAAHAIALSQVRRISNKRVFRKVTLFGCCSDPLQKCILIHGRDALPLFFLLA